MKRAAISFGAMFALLLAVALSVPVGPPDSRGYVPTLLQWGAPLVLALVVLLVVVLLLWKILLASFKDRSEERKLYAHFNQQAELNIRLNLAHLDYLRLQQQQLSYQQIALVQQLQALQAQLVCERGQYYAQLPGHSEQKYPLEVAEAEYWREIAPQQVAGQLAAPIARAERRG